MYQGEECIKLLLNFYDSVHAQDQNCLNTENDLKLQASFKMHTFTSNL